MGGRGQKILSDQFQKRKIAAHGHFRAFGNSISILSYFQVDVEYEDHYASIFDAPLKVIAE